jgi:hypothetical protein
VLRGDGKTCAAGHKQSDGRPVIPGGERRNKTTGRYVSAWQ